MPNYTGSPANYGGYISTHLLYMPERYLPNHRKPVITNLSTYALKPRSDIPHSQPMLTDIPSPNLLTQQTFPHACAHNTYAAIYTTPKISLTAVPDWHRHRQIAFGLGPIFPPNIYFLGNLGGHCPLPQHALLWRCYIRPCPLYPPPKKGLI
jgi:hypothetical protein